MKFTDNDVRHSFAICIMFSQRHNYQKLTMEYIKLFSQWCKIRKGA
jgi:hypothetical protein